MTAANARSGASCANPGASAASRPRRKLCELILWHDQYDAHRHTPDVAVRVADRSVEEFRRSPWSWYSPREIVQWHGWFA